MKKRQSSLYYKEEKNVGFITFGIFLLAILISSANLTINYSKGLTESSYFTGAILVSLLVGLPLYFKFKQNLIAAYITILGTAIGLAGIMYFEGHLSFNFLYFFAPILSVPFLVKRNRSFLKHSFILFITVIIIAAVAILISPIDSTYAPLTKEDIFDKMILNATFSLISVVLFCVITIYASRNFFIALLKDKTIAEDEKDKRMVALTSLGHELRTQITSINGVTQLITEQRNQHKPNKEIVDNYAKILDKCNDQMLNLVNDVLDIHKIESGKFELIEKPENLNNLLIQICNESTLLADTKSLIFHSEINSTIANLNLVFDRMRLAQILRNLLKNAVKYTDDGYVSLKVILVEETATKASILFKIEDSGIGILKKNYSKIFESFEQIKSESADIYGGAGLGLSLAKTFLCKMNSRIEIESEINKGSVFSFKIDFRKAEKENNIQNTELLLLNKSCLLGENILIAEDNNVILLYTDTLLKKYQAKTFLAKDGLEAIEMVKNNKEINTILLDIEMPKLDGFEAIKVIRALDLNLRVIAFTANIPNEALVKKLQSAGFDDFITKPFKKEELIKTIYSTNKKPMMPQISKC